MGLGDHQGREYRQQRAEAQHRALGRSTPYITAPRAHRHEDPGVGQAFLAHLEVAGGLAGEEEPAELLRGQRSPAAVGGAPGWVGVSPVLLATWKRPPGPLTHLAGFLSPQLP